LGEHPDGGIVVVMPGKFGPYVKWAKVNATLPKDLPPETVTLDEALALIVEKAGKGGAKARAKPKASKAATGAATTGKAPAKKAAKARAKPSAGKTAAKKSAPRKAAPKAQSDAAAPSEALD
jgi:DNA topoisomerase-1